MFPVVPRSFSLLLCRVQACDKKPVPEIRGVESDNKRQDTSDLVEGGTNGGKERKGFCHQVSMSALQEEDTHLQGVVPETIIEAETKNHQGEIDPVRPKQRLAWFSCPLPDQDEGQDRDYQCWPKENDPKLIKVMDRGQHRQRLNAY